MTEWEYITDSLGDLPDRTLSVDLLNDVEHYGGTRRNHYQAHGEPEAPERIGLRPARPTSRGDLQPY